MNCRLADLAPRLKARPEAVIEYFVPDKRKAGSMYVSVTCVVRNISVPERLPVMEDGTIPMDDIVAVTDAVVGEECCRSFIDFSASCVILWKE